MISVSINSLPAHLAHGDVADSDGDGYLSGENDCGLPVDCNDDDASLTDNCCPAGAWCGFLTYFDIRVEFNDDCSASVVFNDDPCEPVGSVWTLLSSDGSTFVYEETDPCGITGCTVTLTLDEDGAMYAIYSDCPATAEGSLTPCE